MTMEGFLQIYKEHLRFKFSTAKLFQSISGLTEWSLDEGLFCDFSITLSDGKSRLVGVSVSLIESGESILVQEFEILMNPGIRSLVGFRAS